LDLKMKTLIVNRNTPDLAENQKRQIELMSKRIPSLDNEIIIYNCEEEPFKGKCHGHYRALQEHQDKSCDYYWFNHPDLSFAIDMDCLSKLLAVMEKNPWIAVISPTEDTGSYIDMFKDGYRWHPVARCDYLSLLIRASVIEKIGFMNPDFEFSWGAIHEYSYKVYKNHWCVAYCDIAKMHHFGGTTYGKKGMISRDTYRKNAVEFARDYFIRHYGQNWDKEFAKVLPNGVKNTFSISRKNWEGRNRIKRALRRLLGILGYAYTHRVRSSAGGNESMIRLHLGCENRKIKGWVNIDINDKVKPDIIADVSDLNMFEDEAVDEIESCHPLEHLAHPDAITALKEWQRVLRNGGRLSLELTTLEKNWTPETLMYELKGLGFSEIKQQPVAQTKEKAAKYGSVMRLECIK
jgi:GT2 family glycosyltransferase